MEEKNDLREIFEKIKGHLYEKEYSKMDMPELVDLILKENKNHEEKEKINSIHNYIMLMESSLEDLGTYAYNLYETDASARISQIESIVRKIIISTDEFVDSLTALLRVHKFEESRIEIKQSLAYLKAIRQSLIAKTNEFKAKINRSEINFDNFKRIIADIIDTFVREAYKIRVLKIRQVIEKHLE